MRRRRFVTVTMGVLVLGGLIEAGAHRQGRHAGGCARSTARAAGSYPEPEQRLAGGTAVCHLADIYKRRGAR